MNTVLCPRMRPMMRFHTCQFSHAVITLTLVAGICPSALGSAPSVEATEAVQTIKALQHNDGSPFIVLDKVAATIWVFDGNSKMLGSTPVLVGAAIGDDSVPGIGTRPMSQISPNERTTPAGRFRMEPGRNLNNEDIFWIDYEAAVSLHRLRHSSPVERRPARLASVTPADNRISYGCINLPPNFYDNVIIPLFSVGSGWIYVLPETRPVSSLFK